MEQRPPVFIVSVSRASCCVVLCCVSGLSLVVGGAEVAADYPANKLLGVEGKPENICRTPASGGCQDGKHQHRRLKHTQKEAAGEVEEEGANDYHN